MMSALVLASCSETDENTDSEYDDWQAKNKTAFAEILVKAKQEGEANGWHVYRNWREEQAATRTLS